MRIRAAWNIMNAIYGCRQPATEPSKKKLPTKTNIEYEEVERKKTRCTSTFLFSMFCKTTQTNRRLCRKRLYLLLSSFW